MSPLYVAGVGGEHADELVRRLCVHDHTGLDEDVLPLGNEGIHCGIVDQIDSDGRRIEAVSLGKRILVALQETFGLRVTKEPNLLRCGLLHLEGEGARAARERAGEAQRATQGTAPE